MSKVIDRKITLEFDLEELAKDFGYNLEVDEYEDVYHNGYSKKDLSNFDLDLPEKYQDLEKIFPDPVCIALESAERAAWASYIRKQRIEALEECLEKIDLGNAAEYNSCDGVSVSAHAGISSANVNEDENKVSVTIINPEHLINAIVNGMGYVYPDLPALTESSNEEIKARFHNVKDYFEVYGESKPSGYADNRYSPSIDNNYLSEELEFRVGELTLDDVVEAVKDSIAEGNDLNTIMSLATKFTVFKEKEIAEKIVEGVESEASNWKSNLSNFLED
tara:strand:+ start:7678 stop:8508 length:831 start_codon:yes stop_codon:yes gene_type:complete